MMCDTLFSYLLRNNCVISKEVDINSHPPFYVVISMATEMMAFRKKAT